MNMFSKNLKARCPVNWFSGRKAVESKSPHVLFNWILTFWRAKPYQCQLVGLQFNTQNAKLISNRANFATPENLRTESHGSGHGQAGKC